MRLRGLIFAVLMLVTTAWSQAPAQPPAPAAGKASPQAAGKASAQAAPASAQTPARNPFDAFQHFSAEVSGGPLKWDKMKIYRSGNKIRAEWDTEKEVRISDLTKNRASFVRHWPGKPQKCGTLEKLDIATYPFFAYTGSGFKVESAPVGEGAKKETADGHSCKVENYTVKTTDGGMLIANVKLWEAEDLKGFPIRMEISPAATKPFTLSYANVSIEPPDPKLFRLPACGAGVHPKEKSPAPAKKTPTQASPKPQP